jgi:hypothetical protein
MLPPPGAHWLLRAPSTSTVEGASFDQTACRECNAEKNAHRNRLDFDDLTDRLNAGDGLEARAELGT